MLAVAMLGGMTHAGAQTPVPTPLTGIPKVPKTLPLFGQVGMGTVATAAAADKTDDVTLLLAQHASPDDPDENGRTGLIYAAINNNVQIAQALLNRGAQRDGRDRLGKTALHWAAERGSLEVMRILLAAKVTVDAQNAQGLTPLMLAASKSRVAAARLLLQFHADPKKEDYTGRDATDWAGGNAMLKQSLKTAAGQ
jgi:hypothetical protein